jgi:hypothetical protein
MLRLLPKTTIAPLWLEGVTVIEFVAIGIDKGALAPPPGAGFCATRLNEPVAVLLTGAWIASEEPLR